MVNVSNRNKISTEYFEYDNGNFKKIKSLDSLTKKAFLFVEKTKEGFWLWNKSYRMILNEVGNPDSIEKKRSDTMGTFSGQFKADFKYMLEIARGRYGR